MLTVRAGETVPDAVVALWRQGTLNRIEVQPLSRSEVEALVPAALGARVDGAALDWLWRTSAGNPLFLRELVQGGIEDGGLALADGVWRWRGPRAPGPRLGELGAARLGRLDGPERAAVEVLAIGEPLELDLLAELVPRPVIVGLEQAQLLIVEGRGAHRRARLSHPLYGEVVRAEVGPLRAEEHYRSLADAAERRRSDSPVDVLALAAWRLASGGGGDPEVYLAAVRLTHAPSDPALAARLAQAAIDAGASSFEARLALGEALAWQRGQGQATAVLDSLTAMAASDRERAQAAQAQGVDLFWGRGQAEEAEALLLGVEASIEDGALVAELVQLRAAICLLGGRVAEAVVAARQAVDGPATSSTIRVVAAGVLVSGLALCGRCDQALYEARRALLLADVEPDVGDEVRTPVRLAMAFAHHRAGNLSEAATIAQEVYDQAVAVHATYYFSAAAAMLGAIAVSRGAMVDAVPSLREAVAYLRERDVGGELALALANLAEALAAAGDLDEARKALVDAEAALGPSSRAFAPDVARAGSWVAAGLGELSRARQLAADAAATAGAADQAGVELVALHDGLRLGAGPEVLDRLCRLGPAVEGPMAAAYTAHARALMADDGPGLDAAASAFEQLGACLLAAEAATQAAARHRHDGLQLRLAASRNRAAALIGSCSHPHTPILAEGEQVVALSRREREVAFLAAAGHSNREIAQRIGVSNRTVEGHLARAFAKLGVTHREDLAGAIDPGGAAGARSRPERPGAGR